MKRVLAIILGGGKGSRLYPLTKMRAKPAVPLAGKYRLIDIPISNCINSDISKMYVLTQFNSASLNRHIAQTYNLKPYSSREYHDRAHPSHDEIFAGLVASIFFMPALAQENLVSNSGSAASAGVVSEVGVSFGGVSVPSLALATALITALLALIVEDNSVSTSTSATN